MTEHGDTEMIGLGSTVVLQTTRAVYTTCRIVEWGSEVIRVAYVVADGLALVRGKLVLTSKCDLIAVKDIRAISERG